MSTYWYITEFFMKILDMYSDGDSFHPSMWEEERQQRQRIHFDFDGMSEDEVVIYAPGLSLV